MLKLNDIIMALEIFDSLIKEKTMKNLKKILVLLTLVAMVVSSVAIMAFAGDEEFTGSIEEADALLTAVDADVNIHNGSYVVTSTRPKTNKEKAAAIVGVYDYVTANNLKAAPGYSEFEQRLHAKSLEFLAEVTNAAFDTSAATSYYTYIIALEVVKSFSSIELLEYKPVTNPIYTGTLEAPAAILAGITDADTYDTLLTKMAGIYTYLATNPVNPMVDGYLEFITEYDARALQASTSRLLAFLIKSST